jgi:hypothetical protein
MDSRKAKLALALLATVQVLGAISLVTGGASAQSEQEVTATH